jgi:solute carrier family 35 protein E1
MKCAKEIKAMCAAWYITSMVANTSAGEILNTFPKPVTLTITQFALVTFWCLLLSWLSSLYPALKHHVPVLRNGIRPPNRDIIMATLPLTAFMIGGHILTSDAMSRIPVSLVHTIKGLSPLITVVAYRFIFRISYSWPTYLSLLPLTIGVIMACSTTFASNGLGLAIAFASTILFVTQNIVSKQLFNEAAIAEQEGMVRGRKPDKLNLLAYSSALAFVFTFPIWFWSEGYGIVKDFWKDYSIDINIKTDSLDHGRLAVEYLFNGTFHFVQSLVAFTLLSMVSPVTYSVASLIKRVFVICFALIWFGNKITTIQGVGIALTFLGLYLYDRTSETAKADRRAKLLGMKEQPTLLPLHERPFESPPIERGSSPNGYPIGEEKKDDDRGGPVHRHSSPMGNGWLPPGTKAQETWTPRGVAQVSQPHQHVVHVS